MALLLRQINAIAAPAQKPSLIAKNVGIAAFLKLEKREVIGERHSPAEAITFCVGGLVARYAMRLYGAVETRRPTKVPQLRLIVYRELFIISDFGSGKNIPPILIFPTTRF